MFTIHNSQKSVYEIPSDAGTVMFYERIYVLVSIANAIAVHGYDYAELRYPTDSAGNSMRPSERVRENREELRRIIEMLNGRHGEQIEKEPDVVSNGLQAYGEDLEESGAVEDQVARLKGLLKMLQRNYDHRLKMYPEEDASSRVHVIANPEVLDSFKKDLRSKYRSTSSSSDLDTSTEDLSYYRRWATARNKNRASSRGKLNVRHNQDRSPYKLVAGKPQAVPTNEESFVIFKRSGHRGSTQKRKERGARDLTKSNELLKGYKETKLSWGQVEVSHERFDSQRWDTRPKPRPQSPKGAIGKSPEPNKVFVVSDVSGETEKKLTVNEKVLEASRSVERWRNVKPKRSRPKAKSYGRGAYGNGRTSIPLGKRSVYEEDK
ncbi:unnamed protein product, partial [Iphiclides podalirius]